MTWLVCCRWSNGSLLAEATRRVGLGPYPGVLPALLAPTACPHDGSMNRDDRSLISWFVLAAAIAALVVAIVGVRSDGSSESASAAVELRSPPSKW